MGNEGMVSTHVGQIRIVDLETLKLGRLLLDYLEKSLDKSPQKLEVKPMVKLKEKEAVWQEDDLIKWSEFGEEMCISAKRGKASTMRLPLGWLDEIFEELPKVAKTGDLKGLIKKKGKFLTMAGYPNCSYLMNFYMKHPRYKDRVESYTGGGAGHLLQFIKKEAQSIKVAETGTLQKPKQKVETKDYLETKIKEQRPIAIKEMNLVRPILSKDSKISKNSIEPKVTEITKSYVIYCTRHPSFEADPDKLCAVENELCDLKREYLEKGDVECSPPKVDQVKEKLIEDYGGGH